MPRIPERTIPPYKTAGTTIQHHDLLGREDDDHTNYYNSTRILNFLSSQLGTTVQAFDELLQDISDIGTTFTAPNEFLVSTGVGTASIQDAATTRTSLGVAIGSDVQAFDQALQDISNIGSPSHGSLITRNATNWVDLSPGTANQVLQTKGAGSDPIWETPGNLPLAKLNSPTFTTIQQMQDIFHSSGWVSGGTITNAGGGSINVAAGTGLIRANTTETSTLFYFDWNASNGIAIPIDTVRFIGVEYNGGAPQVVLRTTENWNRKDDFPLGIVVNENNIIHIETNPQAVGDHANNMIQRAYETMPLAIDERTGGLILGETGTRNITLSAGAIWDKLNRYVIASKNTSISDTFDRYYRNGSGGWTREASQTQWPNTKYDNGSGTLATLTANRWATLWFYLEPNTDGELTMVYGQQQHNSFASAELEAPPAMGILPNRIKYTGRLIAKLIFQASSPSAAEILSVFTENFLGTALTDHVNLSNLTWNTSKHTGTANYIAGFDVTGEAVDINPAEVASGEIVVLAIKGSAGTINIGEPVYITGYNIGQNAIEVELADASSSATMPAFGLAKESFTNTVPGALTIFGNLRNQNTGSYPVGDPLYVSETTGTLTNIKPTGTALVQRVGAVARSDATNGIIEIFGAGRTNDLPNLPLDNLWLGNASGVPTQTTTATLLTKLTHASTHITSGTDEIDGDKLDIDWNPSTYTPSTAPTEADSVDNLTAHLYGIDQALATRTVGPGSSTTGAVARYSDTTGKTLVNSTLVVGTDIMNLGGSTVALPGSFSQTNTSLLGLGLITNTLMARQTSDATPTELTADGNTPSASNRLVVPNDTTWMFDILIVARRTDADNESAAYRHVGCIDRNATAASTTLVGTVSKTTVAEDTAAWDTLVDADTTNGSLRIRATGENLKTIRWCAHVRLVQITG